MFCMLGRSHSSPISFSYYVVKADVNRVSAAMVSPSLGAGDCHSWLVVLTSRITKATNTGGSLDTGVLESPTPGKLVTLAEDWAGKSTMFFF